MPARVLAAGAVLVSAPVLQLAFERATTLPVGPSRMLTIAVWLFAWAPLVLYGLDRLGASPSRRSARLALALLVPVVGLAHLLAGARWLDGPFGPVPGGPLEGPVAHEATPGWEAARTARYAELEVHPDRPRSLETLVLVHDGALYVAANMPEDKRWPAEVQADDRVRIRVTEAVHERSARRVEAEPKRRELLAAMNAKYGFDVSLGGDIWFFRLDPR